jgi:hypothetical protein
VKARYFSCDSWHNPHLKGYPITGGEYYNEHMFFIQGCPKRHFDNFNSFVTELKGRVQEWKREAEQLDKQKSDEKVK